MFASVFRDLRNISDSKFSFPFYFASNQDLSKAIEHVVFPNPCVWIVRTDRAGIGPGGNGNKTIGNCGSDVHRAAVQANGKLRGAHEANGLEQRRFVGEITKLVRR